jgi:hypothetical protein
MKAIDRIPRSDFDVMRKNKTLYLHRKHRMQECEHPECITLIGYHQHKLCRMHEAKQSEERMAKKLAAGK